MKSGKKQENFWSRGESAARSSAPGREPEEELSKENGLYNLKICLRENYDGDFEAGLDGILADMEFFTRGGKSSFLVGVGAGMKFDRIALH